MLSSVKVVFCLGHLPFRLSSFRSSFFQLVGCLPFSSSSFLIVFLLDCLPFMPSSIQAVFHLGCLMLREGQISWTLVQLYDFDFYVQNFLKKQKIFFSIKLSPNWVIIIIILFLLGCLTFRLSHGLIVYLNKYFRGSCFH